MQACAAQSPTMYTMQISHAVTPVKIMKLREDTAVRAQGRPAAASGRLMWPGGLCKHAYQVTFRNVRKPEVGLMMRVTH